MFRRKLMLGAAVLTMALPGAAWADSTLARSPNFDDFLTPVNARLGGVTFVNQGLVGTVRLPGNVLDSAGQPIGGFTGLSVDLSTWRHAATGYTGVLSALSGGVSSVDYAPRLERFNLTFNPYTGATDLAPGATQGKIDPAGALLLKDQSGVAFTSRDPLAGSLTRNGVLYPSPQAGDPAAGKISLKAGGLSFLRDGSFYVSDEYGPNIYYFNAAGQQQGVITPTPDILPRVGTAVYFGPNDTFIPGVFTGRRSDQGFEGVSATPDGSRLFAILQSATMQDDPSGLAVQRNNTRVLVYDTSTSKTPTNPVGEYVMQLPTYIDSATGTVVRNNVLTAGATAGATDILALNRTQFLVIATDENGRGGNGNAIAFKSIFLVDTTGATNLVGTPFAGTTPISTTAAVNGAGALDPSITPVQQVELVNMLNISQLRRFGYNLNTPADAATLPGKFKALGLAPVLEEAKPHDFFLLVASDNSATTGGAASNDNAILFYRLTLPNYIDPQALAYLQTALPAALGRARVVGSAIGQTPALAGLAQVGATRRAHYAGVDTDGVTLWAQGGPRRVAGGTDLGKLTDANIALGGEAGEEGLRVGFALTGSQFNGKASGGFDLDGHAFGGALYAAWFSDFGLYIQGAAAYSDIKLKMTRPAAYGQIANSRPPANAYDFDLETGYVLKTGKLQYGPFAEVVYSATTLNHFQESGASVSNGVTQNINYNRTEATLGATAAYAGTVRPSVRLGYTVVAESGAKSVRVQLIDLDNSSGAPALPKFSKGYVTAQAALEGEAIGIGWRAAVDVQTTPHATSGRLTLGLSKTFN